MPIAQPAAWLTKREAADYARVSTRTIDRWISTGRLKVARPSATVVRIRPCWIDAVIEGET